MFMGGSPLNEPENSSERLIKRLSRYTVRWVSDLKRLFPRWTIPMPVLSEMHHGGH